MIRLFFIVSLLVVSLGRICAQDTLPQLQIELNGSMGKIAEIYNDFPKSKFVSQQELHLTWKTGGHQDWQHWYHLPSVGVSLNHVDFGNKSVLGQGYGAIPMMRYDKFTEKNNRISIRFGFGLAYFTKPYDIVSNPENIVIGAHLENMTMLRLEWARPLNQYWDILVGASYVHCSNAHVAVPNVGANIGSLSLGFSYHQKPINRMNVRDVGMVSEIRSAHIPFIQTHLGLQEFPGTAQPTNGPRYLIYGASMGLERLNDRIPTNHKYRTLKGKYSFGIAAQYYQSYHDYILTQELFAANEATKKSWNITAFGQYEWIFGRIGLFVQAGFNIYAPALHALAETPNYRKYGFMHQNVCGKLGYKYYIGTPPNMTMGQREPAHKEHLLLPYIYVGVKTNGGTADFLEFGVGSLVFNQRRRDIRFKD